MNVAQELFPYTGMHTLEINNICQSFIDNSGQKVDVLDNISFEINGPEIVALIGPSGCGKSSLLRLIVGLDKPTSGKLFFDHLEIGGTTPERGIVFQNANLFEWLTVEDNIAFGLKANKIYKEQAFKVQKLIDMVGLKGFEKSYPNQLSGGMASRCALARAFVLNSPLICFDEPLSSLDAFTRSKLQDQILEMQKSAHTSIALVTHDIEEAVYLCNRVIVLSSRPAKIIADIQIDLTYPRNRTSNEFINYRKQITKLLERPISESK